MATCKCLMDPVFVYFPRAGFQLKKADSIPVPQETT